MKLPPKPETTVSVVSINPTGRPRCGWLAIGLLLVFVFVGGPRPRPGMAQDAGDIEAESVEEDLATNVPVWVAELDAPTAQARRSAEQRLIQAGPKAASFVPVVLDHLSIDARQRLERIQTRWRSSKTLDELETTVVNLQKAETLGEALEAISTASGIEFDTNAAGPTVDLTRKIRPPALPLGFWPAIDNVLDQTDLDINFYGGDRTTLALVPRSEDRLSRSDSAAYAGIYRLEPTIVTARRVLGSPLQSGLNITMTISWQPNRTPIGLTIPIAPLQGQLDTGTKLLPQASGESIDVATTTEIAQSQFYLPLQLPPRRLERDARGGDAKPDASEIVRLTGEISALLPGERRKFELRLDEVAPSKQYDAMTVAIESIRQNEPLHEVRVGVELDNADRSLESHRQWIYENEAYLEMPDGTRVDHLGYEVFRQTASGVGIGYLFDFGGSDTPPPGTKLIYESPTSVIKNVVPFILNGIPLP
ncbi:hypothetical protein [Neorhodopirellula pilleata]|uniref:Uncharacterized protein n=1 Tax=Neorhodopirellula pilleata TaxID=2714738 RepID=A0A5C5ZKU2_9BACT|nr:hypothetical protein [Neorhodopirellula pilleata]TWT87043.1 hypothetical protein Pla100_59940 [Neorhodopirellula pilleata]